MFLVALAHDLKKALQVEEQIMIEAWWIYFYPLPSFCHCLSNQFVQMLTILKVFKLETVLSAGSM